MRRTCTHHWILGEPEHGGIHGTCRRCGARRTYPSGLEPAEQEAAAPELAVEELDVSFAELANEFAAARSHALV